MSLPTHNWEQLESENSRETHEEVDVTVYSVCPRSQESCHWLEDRATKSLVLKPLTALIITKGDDIRNEGAKPLQVSDPSAGLGVTLASGFSVTSSMEEKSLIKPKYDFFFFITEKTTKFPE